MPENARLCPICKTSVETEQYVLLHCNAYQTFRQELFSLATEIYSSFNTLNDDNKLVFIFSNKDMVKVSAKTCFKILKHRSYMLYN